MANRNELINRFMDLNVGDMDELQTMPIDNLEAMIDELHKAQQAGLLNLETNQGVDELKRIVDGYV